MSSEPTHDDLLSRLDRLTLPAKEFERAYKLPANMCAQMRQGKYTSLRARPSLEKLAAALDAEDARQATGEPLATPQGHAVGRPRAKADESVQADLVARIQAADEPGKMGELAQYVLVLAAQGKVSDSFARLANESLSRQQQLWQKRVEAEAVGRAGEPLVVEITHIGDWRGGGRCPYCLGTGSLDEGKRKFEATSSEDG